MYPPGTHPVGSTVLFLARSKPAPAFSAASQAHRNHPLTLPVASPGTCRPSGRPLRQRPAAAGRSAYAPRAHEFPRSPEGPFPQATHQGHRFPEPKRLPPTSPSAPGRNRTPCLADFRRRKFLIRAHPGFPERRGRASVSQVLACAPERGAAAGAAGRKTPGPSFRHAFTSRLAPSR